MKIGICGFGFVGGAVDAFFEKRNYCVTIYDKYKKINSLEMLIGVDIIFICLPTNYSEELGGYDMCEVDSIIEELAENRYSGIILIKSTVLPEYCERINKKYNWLSIIANPEFLSAKTANEDFKNQKQVVLGYTSYSKEDIEMIKIMYREILGDIVISVVRADEAALIKLGCNSFYATKIEYFTELYMLCNRLGVSYETVKGCMIGNGWINSKHTEVPGSDGEISFGGMCFPKDIKALSGYMGGLEVKNKVLKGVIEEMEEIRGVSK